MPPALRPARELGLKVAFSHQCQVPPCVLPDDTQHLESLWFSETSAMWEHIDRAYGPRCDPCALRTLCSGVWRGYVDHFGTDELVPFADGEIELATNSAEPRPSPISRGRESVSDGAASAGAR